LMRSNKAQIRHLCEDRIVIRVNSGRRLRKQVRIEVESESKGGSRP
jgi:hypothetical protein